MQKNKRAVVVIRKKINTTITPRIRDRLLFLLQYNTTIRVFLHFELSRFVVTFRTKLISVIISTFFAHFFAMQIL